MPSPIHRSASVTPTVKTHQDLTRSASVAPRSQPSATLSRPPPAFLAAVVKKEEADHDAALRGPITPPRSDFRALIKSRFPSTPPTPRRRRRGHTPRLSSPSSFSPRARSRSRSVLRSPGPSRRLFSASPAPPPPPPSLASSTPPPRPCAAQSPSPRTSARDAIFIIDEQDEEEEDDEVDSTNNYSSNNDNNTNDRHDDADADDDDDDDDADAIRLTDADQDPDEEEDEDDFTIVATKRRLPIRSPTPFPSSLPPSLSPSPTPHRADIEMSTDTMDTARTDFSLSLSPSTPPPPPSRHHRRLIQVYTSYKIVEVLPASDHAADPYAPREKVQIYAGRFRGEEFTTERIGPDGGGGSGANCFDWAGVEDELERWWQRKLK